MIDQAFCVGEAEAGEAARAGRERRELGEVGLSEAPKLPFHQSTLSNSVPLETL